MQIVEEHQYWRRIRDPEGTEGWVQRPLLTSRRSFLVQGEERVLRRRRRRMRAAPVARLAPRRDRRLRHCEAGSAWCEAKVGDYRGWIKRSEIWGVRGTRRSTERGWTRVAPALASPHDDAEPTDQPSPAIHDIGGLSRFRCTAVERDEAPPDAFGKRVDALRQVLARRS